MDQTAPPKNEKNTSTTIDKSVLLGILLFLGAGFFALSYLDRYWVASTNLTVLVSLIASVVFFFRKINIPLFIVCCALAIFVNIMYIPLAILIGYKIFDGEKIFHNNQNLIVLLFWGAHGILSVPSIYNVVIMFTDWDVFYGAMTLLSIVTHFVVIAIFSSQLFNIELNYKIKLHPVKSTNELDIEEKIKLMAKTINVISYIFLGSSIVATLVMIILYAIKSYDIYLILALTLPFGGIIIWALCRPIYLFTWGYGHLIGNSNRLVNNTAPQPTKTTIDDTFI